MSPDADVDLDAGADQLHARPQGWRGLRPRWLPLCVVAAVVGAWAHSLAAPPPPPGPPVLSATSTLRSVVLAPGSAAVVDVTLLNSGPSAFSIASLEARSPDGTARLDAAARTLPPGGVDVLSLTLPVRCPYFGIGAAPPRIDVRARTSGAGGRSDTGTEAEVRVEAVPVGELARLGGVCAVADRSLPPGWRSPARATLLRADDAGLRLRVAGLPAFDRVDTVRLGPWFLRTAVAARQGAAVTLELGTPPVDCRDPLGGAPAADGLPAALSLTLGRDGALPLAVLAPAGPALSRWSLRQVDLSCPGGVRG